MADDIPINWQALNIVEDEAPTQGTRALRSMIKGIHEAQQNPNL